MRIKYLTFIAVSVLFFAVGCDNMRDGNRFKPYEKTDFFDNGNSSRPLIEGTVARGFLRDNAHLYEGKVNGELAEGFPMKVTGDMINRGMDRYQIYCIVCHGANGDGDGLVVERGFNAPPSFHEDRLRDSNVGHFFDVMTNGRGVMASYATELTPEDRWAIASYIRVLQAKRIQEEKAKK